MSSRAASRYAGGGEGASWSAAAVRLGLDCSRRSVPCNAWIPQSPPPPPACKTIVQWRHYAHSSIIQK
eukprot:jgi/Chlat1/3656/Chrsp238S03645